MGSGRQLPHHPAGTTVTGVDPDGASLARAARRAPRARLVLGNAETLPFEDGSFDWVVAALVLCTVHDPAAALAEARRVLAPAGRLRVLEHVRSPHAGLARIQTLANPLWGALAGGCRLDRPTDDHIASAGFTVVSRRAHLGGHVIALEAEVLT